jgi:hypothetical protein
MHFDDCSCSLSHTFILMAAGCSTMLFRGWQSVHKVIVVVCMLDKTLVVVLEVIAAAIVGSDVAVSAGGSEHERRGWGPSWGVVGRFGSE